MGPRLHSSKPAARGARHKDSLWAEGDPPNIIAELEDQYYLLDHVSLYSVFTLFRINRQSNVPELVLYTYPNNFYPLKLSFQDYTRIALEVRGLHLWQAAYIDAAGTEKSAIDAMSAACPDDFSENLAMLFPETEWPADSGLRKKNTRSFRDIAIEKNYRKRLLGAIEKLKMLCKNGHVKFSENEPLSVLAVRKTESILGRRLPDDLLAIYKNINGRLSRSPLGFERWNPGPQSGPTPILPKGGGSNADETTRTDGKSRGKYSGRAISARIYAAGI
jgi:hypothetical protein